MQESKTKIKAEPMLSGSQRLSKADMKFQQAGGGWHELAAKPIKMEATGIKHKLKDQKDQQPASLCVVRDLQCLSCCSSVTAQSLA